jgi:CubicO group peptidase (beta-lactamase class C family)
MRDPALDLVASSVVDAGVCRKAVVAAAFRAESGWDIRTGVASAEGPIHEHVVFDLASVTKPHVAVTLARVAQSGRLSLTDPLEKHLPELASTPSGSLSLELFLAHRAGLEAHVPLFDALQRRQSFRRSVALERVACARRRDATGPVGSEGFSPVYSDLGYVLLGAALERATGKPLDQLLREEVADPLSLDVGSARFWLSRDAAFPERAVPTEVVAWRGGLLRGVVHDENAWALAGHGLAGQAGLFGTAEAVAGLGIAVLDSLGGRRLDWLSPVAVTPLVRERAGGSLRAGFDGKSAGFSAAGRISSPRTFGHLGFTGTSLWCDPEANTVTVLLTNRVCPTRENQRIREARPRTHDALFEFAARGGLVSREKP